MRKRDYIQTFDLLQEVNSVDFWREEICFALDGERDIQIKFQGGISEYFKDIINKTPNTNFQKLLFSNALSENLKNFDFDGLFENIEEDPYCKTFFNYLRLSRTFCSKNLKVVELFTDSLSDVADNAIQYNKTDYFESDKYKKLFSSVRYMVEDALPNSFSYLMVGDDKFPEYSFLERYFRTLEKLLNHDGNVLLDSLVQLIYFGFPVHITSSISKELLENEEFLESVITEFKSDQIKFESLINALFIESEDRNEFIQILQRFNVPDKLITQLLSVNYHSNVISDDFGMNFYGAKLNPLINIWMHKEREKVQNSGRIVNLKLIKLQEEANN